MSRCAVRPKVRCAIWTSYECCGRTKTNGRAIYNSNRVLNNCNSYVVIGYTSICSVSDRVSCCSSWSNSNLTSCGIVGISRPKISTTCWRWISRKRNRQTTTDSRVRNIECRNRVHRNVSNSSHTWTVIYSVCYVIGCRRGRRDVDTCSRSSRTPKVCTLICRRANGC